MIKLKYFVASRRKCCSGERYLNREGPRGSKSSQRESFSEWYMIKDLGIKQNLSVLLAGSIWQSSFRILLSISLWLCRPGMQLFLWDMQFVSMEEVAPWNTSESLSLYFLRFFSFFDFIFSEIADLWNCLLGIVEFVQSLFPR